MLYCLTAVMYFLNFRFGKSKYFSYFLFMFLLVLLAGSYGTYDTMIFYNRYIQYEKFSSFTEPLFTIVVRLFNQWGFSCQQFMLVLSFTELCGLFWFLNKYCKNHTVFFSLFIIFPMLSMFVQLRFLMGFIIVLCGSFPALIERRRLWQLRYIFWLVIAYLFHSSSIVYIVFLLAAYLDLKKTGIVSVIFIAIFSSAGYIQVIISYVSRFYNIQKLESILTATTGTSGQLGRCLLSIAMSIGMFIILWFIKKHILGNYDEDADNGMLDLMLKVDLLSLVFVPMIIFFSSGFYRIPQSLLVLNYITISNNIRITKKWTTTSKSLFLFILTIGAAFVLFYMMYSSAEMQEIVIKPFFKENLYINWLGKE
ncbi:EpsG family protein [Clostridium sp. WB02_MRS01]|uniref:EpsG family protein n=1 Tax=Clostridium sp. WB02_MRS01 TaxID=2605777 RepID=UPI0012B32A90|nr:EpsG family protein [Clostridium sp. WB02_MRS01]MSS10116.1 EpsG family protein [Clostridium sp. WB02_MRS01]